MSEISSPSLNPTVSEVAGWKKQGDYPAPASPFQELGITRTLVEVFSVGRHQYGKLADAIVQARREQDKRENRWHRSSGLWSRFRRLVGSRPGLPGPHDAAQRLQLPTLIRSWWSRCLAAFRAQWRILTQSYERFKSL